MEVGVQTGKGFLDEDLEIALDGYMRCPHCYQSACKGCERQRHSRYSPADYQPYQLTEDDLIACIDLLNSITDEDFE